MSSRPEMTATAVRLMRLALPLLDQSGQGFAAARLQHAIDTVDDVPVRAPTDEELNRFLESDLSASVQE